MKVCWRTVPMSAMLGAGLAVANALRARAAGAGALEEVERLPVAHVLGPDLDSDLVADERQPVLPRHRARAAHREQERPVLGGITEVGELPVRERQHLPAVVDEVARAWVAVHDAHPLQCRRRGGAARRRPPRAEGSAPQTPSGKRPPIARSGRGSPPPVTDPAAPASNRGGAAHRGGG